MYEAFSLASMLTVSAASLHRLLKVFLLEGLGQDIYTIYIYIVYIYYIEGLVGLVVTLIHIEYIQYVCI